jgi:Stage II sporulation protein E (SpoIIE)
VTAVIGFWDQHRAEFSWTNCGHLRPLLVRDEWVRELVADTTYPLGILGRERTFPSSTVPVRPGDRVFIYSDGIVEAPMGDGERFGLGRLKRLLVQTAGQPPAATAAALERSVLQATGGEIADDATQLLLAIGDATWRPHVIAERCRSRPSRNPWVEPARTASTARARGSPASARWSPATSVPSGRSTRSAAGARPMMGG